MEKNSRARQRGSGGEEREGILSRDSGGQGSHHCKGDSESPEGPKVAPTGRRRTNQRAITDAETEGSWKHTGGGGRVGRGERKADHSRHVPEGGGPGGSVAIMDTETAKCVTWL